MQAIRRTNAATNWPSLPRCNTNSRNGYDHVDRSSLDRTIRPITLCSAVSGPFTTRCVAPDLSFPLRTSGGITRPATFEIHTSLQASPSCFGLPTTGIVEDVFPSPSTEPGVRGTVPRQEFGLEVGNLNVELPIAGIVKVIIEMDSEALAAFVLGAALPGCVGMFLFDE